MEAPSIINDAAADPEDVVYPCKGCGEILEEGKAFELAGNRWHIDCFRCNTCGTLLDSDANLLLLGDGSLICNNCTYSCSACGNKIEDLAILTGDQAFCAACFKCRNCKRKIENLRYARTSQGIFCMQCHESLMARRRKKSRNARATSANSGGSNAPIVLDKSLPALPPHILPTGTLNSDGTSSTKSSESLESSRTVKSRKEGGKASPARYDSKENLTLPASTYNGERQSVYSPLSDADGDEGDEFFMTVSMDPSPGPPPMSPERNAQGIPDASRTQPGKEYFGALKPTSPSAFQDDFGDLVAGSSRSGSRERGSVQAPKVSPHIAYQEKGRRQSSVDLAESIRKRNLSGGSTATSTITSPLADGVATPYSDRAVSGDQEQTLTHDPFKLGEPPRMRRSMGSRSISKTSGLLELPTAAGHGDLSNDASSDSSPNEGTGPPAIPRRRNSSRLSPFGSGDDSAATTLGDVLRRSSMRQTVLRKDLPEDASQVTQSLHSRQPSGVSSDTVGAPTPPAHVADFLVGGPPARSAARPGSSSRPTNPLVKNDSGPAPTTVRDVAPAVPPPRHKPNESISSIQSEHFHSERYPTALPAPSPMIDFSMEEEMGRIMRGEEAESQSTGLFRRVSKAVRHNRSHSDTNKVTPNTRWMNGRTARNGSVENSPLINSATAAAAESKEELLQLRNRLDMSQQRVAELEAERDSLHEKVQGVVDLRQVNSELREKRSTMAFLDTQREMVIRELEIMTEHLGRAKNNNEAVDIGELKSEALKDFTASLRKLKDTLGVQIEDLVHKKNELTVDCANLNQTKERAMQELENINTKNAQLAELNNQLVHNIQELYKHGSRPNGAAPLPMPMPVPMPTHPVQSPPSGLGIYSNIMRSDLSLDQSATRSSADHSMSHVSGLSGDTEIASEGGNNPNAPQVINIRKGVQPKKFSWKKSGAVAKNVTKGFKGAFGLNENQQPLREEFAESAPYGSLPQGEAPLAGAAPSPPPSRMATDQNRQAWAMRQAAAQKGFAKTTTGPAMGPVKEVATLAPPAETAVFGSELTARCDFERRVIPAIITRCIEEVERRGMTVEGIYRKSGSSTQVKAIQASFERDYTAAHEIGNPDLDIHAVTSALKQYLRRLPVPLITWDCYDALLDAASPAEEGDMDKRVLRIKHCVDSLPARHRDTLEFLVAHLVRVMEREQQNLMTPLNLAVVFAPTIMRPAQVEREMSDMQAQRVAVQTMLEQATRIFGEGLV